MVDLTNDSGVEDETVVDLTSPIRVGVRTFVVVIRFPPPSTPPLRQCVGSLNITVRMTRSSLQHIPPISDYIGTMSLGFPLRVTAGPPFQEGYPSNRPSCTLPVQLVESDEEVEEVNTSER